MIYCGRLLMSFDRMSDDKTSPVIETLDPLQVGEASAHISATVAELKARL